ncbi:MAG: cytidylate kinase-like family protein [Prevotella sp.]|nr:cytidylate kinase-like family protein [Prevotella sp.]MBR1839743.1 cytidylate kinase-like family protein [Prevotella sp.]
MDNLIISVGRQLGSGGCEIAKLLAQHFDCKYYDHELINMAAERSGFNPRIFEKQDESHGTLKSLFGSFSGRLGRATSNYYKNAMSQESLFQVQSEAIWKAAKEDNCVFVGRCADYILREKPGLFSVFITADETDRINAVAQRHNCDYETARKIIQRKEARRANYYNYYTSKKWGASQSYDLCINSSLLGIERTAEVIAQIIREVKYKV